MKNGWIISGAVVSMLALLATCGAGSHGDGKVVMALPDESFSSYWYQGRAEVSRFELVQARYGELRKGHAVLIQVTEDFLTDEQVKYDGEGDGQRTSVLKTNLIERYTTGIYDYSHMTSVFSPVDGSPALKVNNSVQDWCGQVFAQLNRRNDGYAGRSFSYFQGEGDRSIALDNAWLEDALFNQVRIDPEKLPMGNFRVMPSLRYLRLMHKPMEATNAVASLKSDGRSSEYIISMPSLDRTLSIFFEPEAPHKILGWRETRPDGWGASERKLTTEAQLIQQVMEPYWQQNTNADSTMRRKLGLP